MLQDVHYVIDAHFDLTDHRNPSDNPAKFQSIFVRRAARGQCFHQPYFGCREFPVAFRPWDGDKPQGFEQGIRELGYMLYDIDFSDPSNLKPQFFKARLVDGVLDITDIEVHA